MEYTLIATATFGLEKVVADELRELGYDDLTIENGKVTFQGSEMDIVTCNMWLRTADRVLIKMAEFKAESFEELFQGTLKVEWGDIIPETGFMHVVGKSVKSKLFSVPDCQSITKKAVVESMKRKYNKEVFSEDGATYKIEVAILKDIVTLTLDTTGPGLHKRGYREFAGEAPLKETLAAALVLLSKWEPSRILADPFCGSGTIAIEAAMIGKNIAPGINRSFVSEDWDIIPKKLWEDMRKYARNSINDKEFRILASDINGRVLKTARDNAEKAGVADYIAFQRMDMKEFRNKKRYGFIITNPPYGERMGNAKEIENLYKDMGEVFQQLKDWSYFVITSYEDFEKCFGEKSDKNRKLYNGRIKCYYYQYFGAEPEKNPWEK
ncbi:class I SAM-dependent RNA methyltransferase [Clostridium cochlearium]|uniref:N6-adenine-specific DNA methylase n=1 Tax=Clostridium cochlearium TaxID=1494 RepID=A0ABY0QLA3_CLOCO|nr:class I SAM-dependent RNA methyltransferase [Clostridium cochlearium]MBV1819302.1 class I SAM-dependent RNA methyltransferase [Bacteroidales bacterium MSK.15.36]MCG4571456.1 class I SAM-dependent RNA methyltransferase [Clostridium cochlearium]MCG4580346.1 class I SAM-dependent RNA methyltransferase [Clostridium cochlearium]NMA57101.1 class I SAM-dependent RNA methyltransferase [Clostridium cochlearium]SDL14425.1 putative N6-adenine-specific DNA methylase [Clostridium cochlearium]